MPHRATPAFWHAYRGLPDDVRELADKNFALLQQSPSHPSLHLKKVKAREGLWSARVGRGHRALATETDDGLLWFWIGPHSDYDRIIG